MFKTAISRRKLIQGSLLLSAGACAPITLTENSGYAAKSVTPPKRTNFNEPSDVAPREKDLEYEVQLSDAEWKSRLSKQEYQILREGLTEKQKTSDLWNEVRAGDYRCKGCNLLNYSSDFKVNLDKGYVFFQHSEPDAVLTGIDLDSYYNINGEKKADVLMETHCRRCGSHLGHLVYMKKQILHCINGTSLTFESKA